MTPAELAELSLVKAGRLIRDRQLSPVELIKSCLERIHSWDGQLHACIKVLEESALAQARAAEKAVMSGDSVGPLHGIPLALKDIFAMRGEPLTCGSRAMDGVIPDYDSTVVARLRGAGGIFVAALNLHEFASGSTTANPHYGVAHNPWKLDRIPGGSSGGSGIAVATSMCLGSVGTDTGGSIRLPSSLCGIVGLKPTYGRISRYGMPPLSFSMDHAGPMTSTVADTALMLQVMAGADDRDPSCSHQPVPDYSGALTGDIRKLRVGLPKEYLADAMDDEVRSAFAAALEVLRGQGATLEEVSLPHSRLGPPAMVATILADAGAVHGARLRERSDKFSDTMRRLVYAGLLIPSRRYIQAKRARSLIAQDHRAAFERVDIMALPTTSITATPIGATTALIGGRQIGIDAALPRLTLPFNLSGVPAISLPCGFSREGLPIGLQLAGRPFDEATVLRVADAYERATTWHRRRPHLET